MTGKSQTNLIVNYLPQTLTDEEFTSMFESIGPLNASKIVRDRNTSYSYGFGFVDFVSAADAVRAVETLNGLQLQNKNIKVAYARTGDNIKGGNLYVRNVPVDMSETQVQEIFTPFGVVVQCRVLIDQATGRSKGVCFVLFETRSQAEEAITSLNGHVLEGSCTEPLKVQFAEDNKGKPRPPGEAMGGRGSFMPRGRGGPRGGGGYPGRGGGFGGVRGGGGYGASPRGRGGYGAGYNGGGAGYDSSYDGSGYDNSYGSGYDNYESGYGPMRTQTPNHYRYNPMSGGGGGGGGGANYNAGSGYTSFNNGNGATQDTAAQGDGFVLFAYNIGADTDESGLWQLFSPFGEVQKVNVIRDGQKGTGKGYGFVTMGNHQEAANAVQGLDGYKFADKPLQVSFKTNKST